MTTRINPYIYKNWCTLVAIFGASLFTIFGAYLVADYKCVLEKELSEPFQADYLEKVKKAREAVRDEKE